MSKKITINCITSEKIYIDLTSEEEAQRVIDKQNALSLEAEQNAKMELNKKINDETKVLAIQSLIDKDDWP